jgi:hypothetical protein
MTVWARAEVLGHGPLLPRPGPECLQQPTGQSGRRQPKAGAGPATLLDDQAATEALQRYAVAHPRAWAHLRPVLEQTLGARIDQWGSDLPVIALDITTGTPP